MKTKTGTCKDSTKMERITNGEKITEGLLLRGTGAGGLLRFEKLKSNYNYRSPVLLP